ncbi:MAG TPA: hypothetical protein V6C58_26380 [Allocoleopsis sp.]
MYKNLYSKKIRTAIIFLSAGFFAFLVFYYFKSKLIRLDSIPIAIETILLLTYIVFFFYEYLKKETTLYINNHYCFWLAFGILIYLGGSFFFYLSINHLNQAEVDTFGKITFIIEIIKNLLFSLSIVVYYKYHSFTEKTEPKLNIPFLDM